MTFVNNPMYYHISEIFEEVNLDSNSARKLYLKTKLLQTDILIIWLDGVTNKCMIPEEP